MRVNTLRIEVRPFHGVDVVDLVVDGRVLDDSSGWSCLPASELLAADALRPTVPPRRIALYGCGCGELGCTNVTAVVERDGWLVRWRDLVSVTGWPYGAVPDDEDPDPAQDEELVHRLDLPDLAFAADEYAAVVAEATRRTAAS